MTPLGLNSGFMNERHTRVRDGHIGDQPDDPRKDESGEHFRRPGKPGVSEETDHRRNRRFL